MSDENSQFTKNIDATIASYRKKTGLSQAQFAELIELSNDTIFRMERGNIVLNVPPLFEFAEVLDCQFTDLLMVSSRKIEDQSNYVAQLLVKLTKKDRVNLIAFIE